MIVFPFTYNSSGKYALFLQDDVTGPAFIYNQESEMIAGVNNRLNYPIGKSGANYILTGKAKVNYLSAITFSGSLITSITWSTNPASALTTNDINQAVSIAQRISLNF